MARNGGNVRFVSLGNPLLAFAVILAITTPPLAVPQQGGIKKQESLPADAINERIRKDLGEDVDEEEGIRDLFELGDQAVPALIKLLSDPAEARRGGAARGLAYIQNQQGMQALRLAVKMERDEQTKSIISCSLAGGLVDSKSETDLHFLRSLVEGVHLGDDDQDFPAFCAALTLGMMGSSDSLPLLRKAAGADLLDSEEIGKAILWMESQSNSRLVATEPRLSDEEQIKKIVLEGTFFAQSEQSKTSVEELRFNRQRSKALVSLEIFNNPKSARGYDLVLAKENGDWRVVGIWFAWIA